MNPVPSEVVLVNVQNSIQSAIDTQMQSKNLKLFPISPELGENYQYQKQFRASYFVSSYIASPSFVTSFIAILSGCLNEAFKTFVEEDQTLQIAGLPPYVKWRQLFASPF